jgi:glycosyltransferase involved in cell wall biosynthesis
MPRSPVDLSVIIPFRNAAPHIHGQLEALASQACDHEWEVVAVDNGSSDNSREIVESFRDRLNLVILDVATKRGAGHARNVGARHASAERLIFIDADDAVAPGYLREMAAGFDHHDFVTSNFDHSTLNPEWVRDAHGPLERDPADPLGDHFGVMPSAGGSIGITRQIFEAFGGFPEDFRRM